MDSWTLVNRSTSMKTHSLNNSLKSIMSEQILKKLSKCLKKKCFTFAHIKNINIFETIRSQIKFLVSRNIYCSRSARILCFSQNHDAGDSYDITLLESFIQLSCAASYMHTLTVYLPICMLSLYKSWQFQYIVSFSESDRVPHTPTNLIINPRNEEISSSRYS